MAQITVTVSGPRGTSFPLVAEIIQDALQTAGVDTRSARIHTRDVDELWDASAALLSRVRIIEKVEE